MSLKIKRGLLLGSIVVLTVVCYIILNRNYDPLSRYTYSLTSEERELILENMDELEIKYIIDYSISPAYFNDFVRFYNFNAFYTEEYYQAKLKLIRLDNEEIVNVVNRIETKHLDFDSCMSQYQYLPYSLIMESLG